MLEGGTSTQHAPPFLTSVGGPSPDDSTNLQPQEEQTAPFSPRRFTVLLQWHLRRPAPPALSPLRSPRGSLRISCPKDLPGQSLGPLILRPVQTGLCSLIEVDCSRFHARPNRDGGQSTIDLASIVPETLGIGLTAYQLRMIVVIRSRGGSHTGPQLEGDCVKRPGLSSEESRWRKSRSAFYSNLRDLCNEGKVERFALIHYADTKKGQVGYRMREETAGSQAHPTQPLVNGLRI